MKMNGGFQECEVLGGLIVFLFVLFLAMEAE